MLLALFFRFILWSIGWQLMSTETLQYLHRWNRIVIVFSHTSYVDFYIMILYILAYPDDLCAVRMLVKPQPFNYVGWLLRKFGAIPGTSIDEVKGGAVIRVVKELQKDNETLFLISPKGTIVKREWRSGYYHIAQALQAPLLASGLDYEQHAIVVSSIIDYNNTESVIKAHLYEQLGNIVPLFPDDEVMNIRPHKSRSIIDRNRVGSIILVVSFLVWWLL